MNDWKFIEPVRNIKVPSDMSKWNRSKAYHDYMTFVMSLNEVVRNTKITDSCYLSSNTKAVVGVLESLSSWIDEIPPLEQPQRFGNKSYREWYLRLLDNSENLISALLPESVKAATIELKAYFNDSFGNQTRIDYGTGHEAAFIFFLCGLHKILVLTDQDKLATVIIIFNKYLEVCRKLQTVYRMEPAGSQGVWGLDDFQFMPYIWGSSQLIGNTEEIKPQDIPSDSMAAKYSNSYLFFGCIRYLLTVKSGPFAEHSNVLWGVSSVAYWDKVNSGLLRMYQAEVLSKFPVIQHFFFGSLMSIEKAEPVK
ncbi:serine/threonine-protein phosphatase 2A activator isoform X2 [Hydra vulgaris]|uniref:Serine/threonine-protein phosphatase 2A activator n=1 Tax=Hydra vulgaris TaxID=6087 RepID=A0ABM4DJP2_HYDVU